MEGGGPQSIPRGWNPGADLAVFRLPGGSITKSQLGLPLFLNRVRARVMVSALWGVQNRMKLKWDQVESSGINQTQPNPTTPHMLSRPTLCTKDGVEASHPRITESPYLGCNPRMRRKRNAHGASQPWQGRGGHVVMCGPVNTWVPERPGEAKSQMGLLRILDGERELTPASPHAKFTIVCRYLDHGPRRQKAEG